ncbi:MAG: TRAP transporter substrate-binding protein [Synergistaceae bacterium]|nr:TRAP transporter substrate-binding protein [Synergistaceae bacterium]
MFEKKWGKIVAVLVLLCISPGLFAGTAQAAGEVDHTKGEKHSFTVATGVVMNNPIQLAISEMCRRIQEITGGRISFSEHHNSALGSERELLEQESTGMIDMVGGGSQVAYNFVQTCGVFDLPYLFMSNEHAEAVLGSEIGKNILKQFEGTGIKPLTWIACGWRSLTANEPIRTPKEIAGKKIRAMENAVYIDMYNAVGANPTPMAFTELYTALQQGTVDGMDNPPIVINSGSFDDVQKYLMLTEHTFAAGLISMSQELYDSLSSEDQELFQSVAADMLAFSFRANDRVEGESIKAIEARGHMQVLKVDKKIWADAMRTIYPKYEAIYGPDFVRSIVDFKFR